MPKLSPAHLMKLPVRHPEHTLVGVAALLLLLPALAGGIGDPRQTLLGIEEVDAYGTHWFYWMTEQLAREGLSGGLSALSESQAMFYPYGKDLYAHTGSNVLDAFLAMPLRLLFGPVLGYNLFCLLLWAANGAAAWVLLGSLVSSRAARLLGSLWLACAPYVLYELLEGRPTQALIVPVILSLHYAWKLGQERGLSAALLGGICLALAGLQYWFYAFFTGLAVLGLGLLRSLRPPEGESGLAVLTRYATMGVVALLICAPFALPLAQASAAGDTPGLLLASDWTWESVEPITREGTEVGLLIWSPWWRQSGFFVIKDGATHFLGHQANLSWVMIGLLALWCWRPGRLDRPAFLVIFLIMSAVAMGPMLILSEGWVQNPLYVSLVQQVGFLQRLWWPGRAYAVLAILFGAAAAVALDQLLARRRRWGLLLGCLVSGAWSADLWRSGIYPLPGWEARVPAGYQCLAHGEEGAIIELPFGWNQAHLYYQTAHGRPMLGGMLEANPVFTPAEAVELRKRNSWLRRLLGLVGWVEPYSEAPEQAERLLSELPQDSPLLPPGQTLLGEAASLREREAALKLLQESPAEEAALLLMAATESSELRVSLAARKALQDRSPQIGDDLELRDLGYRYVVLQKDALLLPGDADETALRVNRTRLRRYREGLSRMVGPPVYEDGRIALFAPWGDPSPCAGQELPRDEDLGRPPRQNPTASIRYLPTHELQRWLP